MLRLIALTAGRTYAGVFAINRLRQFWFKRFADLVRANAAVPVALFGFRGLAVALTLCRHSLCV
jgi:hypothetical protein